MGGGRAAREERLTNFAGHWRRPSIPRARSLGADCQQRPRPPVYQRDAHHGPRAKGAKPPLSRAKGGRRDGIDGCGLCGHRRAGRAARYHSALFSRPAPPLPRWRAGWQVVKLPPPPRFPSDCIWAGEADQPLNPVLLPPHYITTYRQRRAAPQSKPAEPDATQGPGRDGRDGPAGRDDCLEPRGGPAELRRGTEHEPLHRIRVLLHR